MHWSFSYMEQNCHWIQRIQGNWQITEAWIGLNLKIRLSRVSSWHCGSKLASGWQGFKSFYWMTNFCHWIRWIQWKHLGKTQLLTFRCRSDLEFKLLFYSVQNVSQIFLPYKKGTYVLFPAMGPLLFFIFSSDLHLLLEKGMLFTGTGDNSGTME